MVESHGFDGLEVCPSGVCLCDDGGVAFALSAGAVVCPGCSLSGEDIVDFGEEGDGFSIGEVVDSVESGVVEQLLGLEGEDAVEGRHGWCWC